MLKRAIIAFSDLRLWGDPYAARRSVIPLALAALLGALLAVCGHTFNWGDNTVLLIGCLLVFLTTPLILLIHFGPLLPKEEFERRYPGIKPPGTK